MHHACRRASKSSGGAVAGNKEVHMNQFKSIRELGKVRNTARNQDSMLVTSRRYHSPDAANKEEWAAHAMKHDMDRALLRDEDKGLLAQVETQSVPEITEEAIITLWQSIPRQHQANAVFYMNVVTHNKLMDKFRDSPYHLMSSDRTYGFQLLNKPIVFSNDMPCGNHSNEVLIQYGDFGQVEVLQQGTDPVQEHECITFPGTVEVSMDGYAQVRLLDRQAVKGLRVTG